MINIKQMNERIAQLNEKIEQITAEISQYQKEHDKRIVPYLKAIEESEHALMAQRKNPEEIRYSCRREIEQELCTLKEEIQLFKPDTQFRDVKGHVIVLTQTHLRENDGKYKVIYTAESETIRRSYTKNELKEVIAKDKWRVASATDFRVKAGTTFVHVVSITVPADAEHRENSFYAGFTAKGHAVIFSTQEALKSLPRKDNPSICKLKLMKGKNRYNNYKALYRIPLKGQKMSRWERKVDGYTTVYKAIDKKYIEEITEYLI